MSESNTTTLFTEALNVMNAALSEHSDELPYKALLRASEKVFEDGKIGVAIYDSDPDSPYDYFTIRFRQGSFELVSHGKEEPDVAWKVSRRYLEQVAENPKDYVDNPLKLDWDWLKSRTGVES